MTRWEIPRRCKRSTGQSVFDWWDQVRIDYVNKYKSNSLVKQTRQGMRNLASFLKGLLGLIKENKKLKLSSINIQCIGRMTRS